jgi:hypothetical protein
VCACVRVGMCVYVCVRACVWCKGRNVCACVSVWEWNIMCRCAPTPPLSPHSHNPNEPPLTNHPGAGPARAGDQRQMAQDAAGRQPGAAAHDLALLPRAFLLRMRAFCLFSPSVSVHVYSVKSRRPARTHTHMQSTHNPPPPHTNDILTRATSGSPASSTSLSGRIWGDRYVNTHTYTRILLCGMHASTRACVWACVTCRDPSAYSTDTTLHAATSLSRLHTHTHNLHKQSNRTHTTNTDGGVHVLHALLPGGEDHWVPGQHPPARPHHPQVR